MIKKTAKFVVSPFLGAGRAVIKEVIGGRDRMSSLGRWFVAQSSQAMQVDHDYAAASKKAAASLQMTPNEFELHQALLQARYTKRSRMFYVLGAVGIGYSFFVGWSGLLVGALNALVWSSLLLLMAARNAMRGQQILCRQLFGLGEFIRQGKYFL